MAARARQIATETTHQEVSKPTSDDMCGQVISSPNLAGSIRHLQGVAVVSANDVWAVGSYWGTGISGSRTLAQHWNGTEWSVVSCPYGWDQPTNGLYAISAVAENDVRSVGYATLDSSSQIVAWSTGMGAHGA